MRSLTSTQQQLLDQTQSVFAVKTKIDKKHPKDRISVQQTILFFKSWEQKHEKGGEKLDEDSQRLDEYNQS